MKDQFLHFLRKMARWYWLLILFVFQLVFMWAFRGLFPYSVEKIQQITGGRGLPDSEIYYTYHQLFQVFDAYGETGRAMYLQIQLIDMVYPVVYSLLLAGILMALYKRSRFEHVVFIPFMAALFDYVENILLRTSVQAFPAMNDAVVQIAAMATLLKWSLLVLSLLLMIPGVVARIILWNIQRKERSLAAAA
jgi:hypothetical protein